MRKLVNPGRSRVSEVESKIGISLKTYFQGAIKRGLSQREMGVELDVTAATVCNWMHKLGYEPVMTYRERKGRAA